jgi:uncharacterized iron-regulated membrane protein
MKPEKKPTRWQKIRKFFTDIHLWLGLGSGLIVIAICFSGTVYVYNTEIREASLSELYKTSAPENASPLSLEELITKTETSTGGNVVSVKTYTDPERTWQLSVKMPILRQAQDDTSQKAQGDKTLRQAQSDKENYAQSIIGLIPTQGK